MIKVLVNDPDTAYQALKESHISASKKPIVVVIMDDEPGKLHEVFKILTQHNINVEDSYGFTMGAKGILVVEVANVPEVSDMLQHSGLHLLTKEEIYAL